MANEKIEGDEQDGIHADEAHDENPFLAALKDPKDEPVVEEEHDDDENVSVEVLKDRLKARNRALSQRDRAIDRMQKEMKELAQKAGTISPEVIAALSQKQTAQEPPVDRIAELKERVSNDPAAAVEIMMEALQNQEARFVDVLRRRDAALLKQTKPPLPESEARAIAALKSLPEYANFSDEQLEVVAKTMAPVVKKVSRPPAPISSGGARKVPANATEKETLAAYAEELRQMGYEL